MSRLAPSPTGALHLGNARTFLINWALARRRGWRLILRIEDFDTPRIKPGAIHDIIDTLRWLGIDWDAPDRGPQSNPLIQSTDIEPYRGALRSLAAAGLAYPCALTRTQIEAAASAPQEGAHDTCFPPSLRPETAGTPHDFDRIEAEWFASHGETPNWRFLIPGGFIGFADAFAGNQSLDPGRIVGDFVLWTKRNQPSYQLAVVVDDHRQGVTQIVRGDDLLDSAARQLLLYRALSYSPEPTYTHLPLVLGSDGRRLAKRHGDTRLERYRLAGVSSEAVIGLIAAWSIPGLDREPISAERFAALLDPNRIPREAVTFTNEDDAWLLSHGG